MDRVTVLLLLVLVLVWSEAAQAGPSFPWSSFRAIAKEPTTRGVARCNPDDSHTEIVAILIVHPPGFYRLWAMLTGPEWAAVRYDEEARPDWVWRGSWSGDTLSVVSVSPYDAVAHDSGCTLLFRTRP